MTPPASVRVTEEFLCSIFSVTYPTASVIFDCHTSPWRAEGGHGAGIACAHGLVPDCAGKVAVPCAVRIPLFRAGRDEWSSLRELRFSLCARGTGWLCRPVRESADAGTRLLVNLAKDHDFEKLFFGPGGTCWHKARFRRFFGASAMTTNSASNTGTIGSFWAFTPNFPCSTMTGRRAGQIATKGWQTREAGGIMRSVSSWDENCRPDDGNGFPDLVGQDVIVFGHQR